MIFTSNEGGGESRSWYYAQSDDTGTSVQRHDSGRVEQAEVETNTAPDIGVVVRVYDPETNALFSAEI